MIIKVIDLPASFIGNYELTHNDIPLLSLSARERSCWASRVSPIKRPGDAWQTGYWIGEIWSSMSLYKMCGRKRKAYFQTHLVCGEWAMHKHKLCTVYVPFINRMYHGDEPCTIPGMQENSWAVEIGFQALHGSLSSSSFLKGAV